MFNSFSISTVTLPSLSLIAATALPAVEFSSTPTTSPFLPASTGAGASIASLLLTSGVTPAIAAASNSLSPPAPPKSFSSSPNPANTNILSSIALPPSSDAFNPSNNIAVFSISNVKASCTLINFSVISFIACVVLPASAISFF